jgi:cell division transport system permease protein
MKGQARRAGALNRLRGRLASWAEAHRVAFRQSLQGFAAHPLSRFATALVLGLTLALPVLAQGVVSGLSALEARLAAQAEWVLFPEGKEERVLLALADALAADPRIASVRIQSAEENLATLLAQPGFGDLRELLGENPLPPILLVEPSRALDAGAREALLGELAGLQGIALALPAEDWRGALSRWLGRARALLLPFAALLALAALAVLVNTLRLDLLERAEEIEVLRLLGAGDRFVQRPFLYGGLSLGALAGALAALVARAVLSALEQSLASDATGGELGAILFAPSLWGSLAVVAFGAALGLSGAWLAVRVHLTRQP